MKKLFIFVLALAVSSAFFACSEDNSKELEKLKKELEAEQNKTATGVKFEGDNMVISFSNGTTTTMAVPEGLQGPAGPTGPAGSTGPAGPQGETGNGIQSITYDPETGILTITMTNGSSSSFSISASADGGLGAALIDDSKGACFLKTFYLGAVPLVENTYDANFNLTKSVLNTVVDGKILKNRMVEKMYSGNQWIGMKTTEFATEEGIDYDYEWCGDWVTFAEDKGEYFFESNGGKNYITIFQCYDGYNELYQYEKYLLMQEVAGMLECELDPYHGYCNNYYGYYKDPNNPNVVYVLGNSSYPYNGIKWRAVYAKYTKKGILAVGDVKSTKQYKLDCGVNNRIEKAHSNDDRFVQFSYNGAGKITKVEEFENETATGRYATFQYNNKNLMVSITEFSPTHPNGRIVGKVEYDANNNPVELWGLYETAYWVDVFDPWSDPVNPWDSSYEKEISELRLLGKIEYYPYKNPLGNTVGAIWSQLNDFKINNAIKRITTVEFLALGSITYKDFNEYGYPQTILGNVFSVEEAIGFTAEFMLDYVVKK